MTEILASAAVLAGAAFMFVAGLGVVRFPDLYTRMHAAAKPASVGVVALMTGVALAFWEGPVTARAVLVALFFLLTAPVASHAIARSAARSGVPLAPGTRVEGPERDLREPDEVELPEDGERWRGRREGRIGAEGATRGGDASHV